VTLGEYIERAMQKHANKTAFICSENKLSFSKLEETSRNLATWLQSRTNKGDRVAVQLPNINQYPIASVAVLRAGLVLVNTNPLYTPREMAHQFKDSGAKILIVLSTMLPKLEEVLRDTDIEWIISVELDEDESIKPITPKIPMFSFNEILSENTACKLNQVFSPKPEDIALLQYTGGTTGLAKGACLTHHNILSNAEQIHERLCGIVSESNELIVSPLPLYHIYAFTVNMIYMLGLGNASVLISNPRDIDAFVQQISVVPFTGLLGINTLFLGLTNHPDFAELQFSNLKLTLSGGTTLNNNVARKWKALTGCAITEGYGLSETSPVVALNLPGKEEIGSIGRPVLNTDIVIRDANGSNLNDNLPGELLIKGPQVMQGYWERPNATEMAFTDDGFFKTGDIAIKQSNGNFRIVDRIKDMIIVSGFNVYPNEIEAVLVSHPSILEAAVIGRPSERTGEAIHAFVTISKNVDIDMLIEYCQENLTRYKIPSTITILAEFPKSSVGKILKRELT
jgi:long-chain acyl-CoA synthetase